MLSQHQDSRSAADSHGGMGMEPCPLKKGEEEPKRKHRNNISIGTGSSCFSTKKPFMLPGEETACLKTFWIYQAAMKVLKCWELGLSSVPSSASVLNHHRLKQPLHESQLAGGVGVLDK